MKLSDNLLNNTVYMYNNTSEYLIGDTNMIPKDHRNSDLMSIINHKAVGLAVLQRIMILPAAILVEMKTVIV